LRLIDDAPGELKLKEQNRRHGRPQEEPYPSRADDRSWKACEKRQEDRGDRQAAGKRNPERQAEHGGQRVPRGGDLIGPDDRIDSERGEHPRSDSSRTIDWTSEPDNER